MKSKIILKILIIFSFTGCYNREQNSLLNEAEALLQNKPDSALSILQQFTPGSQQAERTGQIRFTLFCRFGSEPYQNNK